MTEQNEDKYDILIEDFGRFLSILANVFEQLDEMELEHRIYLSDSGALRTATKSLEDVRQTIETELAQNFSRSRVESLKRGAERIRADKERRDALGK